MIAYKGFDPGLICRGYQFVMGLNVTDKANCARNGFHCAEDPLDCLSYYPDMKQSEYYLVDAGGDVDEDACDSKISCTRLTVLKKLDLSEFCLHALAYMADHPHRQSNDRVIREFGTAWDGFVVVRGVSPKAKGPMDSVLAMAKEDPETREIVQIAMAKVDGITVLPHIWYDINFHAKE